MAANGTKHRTIIVFDSRQCKLWSRVAWPAAIILLLCILHSIYINCALHGVSGGCGGHSHLSIHHQYESNNNSSKRSQNKRRASTQSAHTKYSQLPKSYGWFSVKWQRSEQIKMISDLWVMWRVCVCSLHIQFFEQIDIHPLKVLMRVFELEHIGFRVIHLLN